jgi:hypothetical protein
MVCCVIHAVVQFAMFCLDLSITHGILCHFFSRNDYLVMYHIAIPDIQHFRILWICLFVRTVCFI